MSILTSVLNVECCEELCYSNHAVTVQDIKEALGKLKLRLSRMDGMRSNPVPLQEYLLQGSILEEHGDVLLNRLNGLCDPVETGPEKFYDHELVYTLRGPSPVPPPVVFRVRQAVEHPEAPWYSLTSL
ncbi:hypothetical protein CAPTEDRAFT_197316, partial [Capitella teleta]